MQLFQNISKISFCPVSISCIVATNVGRNMIFLREFIPHFVKLVPAIKVVVFLFVIAGLSALVSRRTELAIQIIPVLLVGCSFKKTWFISLVQFLTSSKNETVVEVCGKKIGDWLLAFSAAAIIPFLLLALTEDNFIQRKNDAVFNAAFIVLMTGFSALRITKHFSEGIHRINTRDDLRDIIRQEFGDVKFQYDELPHQQIKQMLDEYNINPPSRDKQHEHVKAILKKYGLLPAASPESSESE
jgi:hypothetical protein